MVTMEYPKTEDILHVMHFLGHRSIQNTLVYTQLVNFKDDKYTAKVAHSEQEACHSQKQVSNTSATTTEAKSSGNENDPYKKSVEFRSLL